MCYCNFGVSIFACKAVIKACNLLFLITGFGIAFFTMQTLVAYQQYPPSSLFSPLIILIISGVLLLVLAYIGNCGVRKQCRLLLVMYIILSIGMIVALLSASFYGLYEAENKDRLDKMYNNFIREYEENNIIPNDIKKLQTQYKCCGIFSVHDYYQLIRFKGIHSTCCPETIKNCTIENSYEMGCGIYVFEKQKDFFTNIFWISVYMCYILIIAITSALNLIWKLQHFAKIANMKI